MKTTEKNPVSFLHNDDTQAAADEVGFTAKDKLVTTRCWIFCLTMNRAMITVTTKLIIA